MENRYVINRLMNTLGAVGARETVELRTGHNFSIVVETDFADREKQYRVLPRPARRG